MIPVPFNENRFSFFFVADHLLVGQLCTNPKSDKTSIMSESDTMFSERDRRCAAVQLMLSTNPTYDNRTIASTLKMQIAGLPRITGMCLGWWKQSFRFIFMVFGVVSSEGHIIPPHIFEVGLNVNTKVYLDVLKSVVIPWCNQVAGWQTLGVAAGLGAGPQVQRDPGLAPEGVLRLCTLLSLAPLLPRPEPAGLLRSAIRREHHQHDLPQHQSQPDRCHPPSIRRAPTGACGKGMLPVPDRGGDWGWRRLHWIDVSSTT